MVAPRLMKKLLISGIVLVLLITGLVLRFYAHNPAATSLLLRINLDAAHRPATEVYIQRPADQICVSTYAYSLMLQGRSKEGISALEKLKAQSAL